MAKKNRDELVEFDMANDHLHCLRIGYPVVGRGSNPDGFCSRIDIVDEPGKHMGDRYLAEG